MVSQKESKVVKGKASGVTSLSFTPWFCEPQCASILFSVLMGNTICLLALLYKLNDIMPTKHLA